jgi:hypothetical protein
MKFVKLRLFFFCIVFLIAAIGKSQSVPAPPDYSFEENWAALPSRFDSADISPSDLKDLQQFAEADVFFIHPTTNISKIFVNWNADVNDDKLNRKTDRTTVKYQVSAFNGAGKIYCPRYRQAHIRAFFTSDTAEGSAALDLAYSDVRAAFIYYLNHYNQKRPIIIAAHSQGGLHAIRLLHEFFDDSPLQNRLVVAYIMGYPVRQNEYKNIPVCKTPEQTGCFCSWRTFKVGHELPKRFEDYPVDITNPVSWSTSRDVVPKEMHKGMLITHFNEGTKGSQLQTQIHRNILWVNKPKFKGSFLYTGSNFHRGDVNLFYKDIYENAKLRVRMFFKS